MGLLHFFEDARKHERLWLGKGHWDRSTQYLKGAIDELRIFDRPLTHQEVISLYSEGSGVTSIEAAEKNTKTAHIYPNPASGELRYNSGLSKSGIITIRVSNTIGKIVYEAYGLPSSGSLDLSRLSVGIYQISFVDEHSKPTRSLLVLQ